MTRAAVVIVAACMALSCCGEAQAAYDPVASATTTITLDRALAASMKEAGVKIEVRHGRLRGRRISLAGSAGEIDPRRGLGSVESAGTILFRAGRRQVLISDIAFEAKRAPLYARVGGGRLKLAAGAHVASRRAGFGAKLTASHLRLTAKFATRLNKKLRLGHPLEAGQELGVVRVSAEPATVHLKPAGVLSIAFDHEFAKKLDQLFVSVNPIAPASLSAGRTLSFPIGDESTLAPDATAGTLKLKGEVELLQLGSAQMFWREIWLEPTLSSLLTEVDVEPAPPREGVLSQAPFLTVGSGGSVDADAQSRTVSATALPLNLGAAAAQLLNNTFADGEQTFKPEENLGAVSIAATAE